MKSGLQKTRAAALISLAFALSGCAEMVETVGETQDTRLLNPDSVQGERNSHRFDALSLGAKKEPGPADRAATHLRGDVDCPDKAKSGYTFFCVQAASEADFDNEPAARKYLSAGLTLSNELCDAWFNQLQITQITLRQGSDTISSVGSVTAAILGFARAAPEAIGLTASLFGAAKQATDVLASNYIVAADLTSVASAVREYRALYAQDIENATGTWNYYTARRVIMAYDNSCSALFVRKFVNTRVAGGSSASVDLLYDAAINAFVGEWSKYFKTEITVSDLVDIYAYLFLPDAPKPVRDSIDAGLKKAKLAKDEDGTIQFRDGVNATVLTNALVRANIDAILKSRAQARVEAVRAQLAADAAAKSEASKTAEAKAADAKAKVAAAGVIQAQAQKVADDLAKQVQDKTAAVQATQDQAAKTTESTALLSVQTQVAAQARDLAGLQDKSKAATDAAVLAKANTAAAASLAQTATDAATTAGQAALDAQSAASVSKGSPVLTAQAQAAAAPAPLGRNNKPLDSPPPP